METEKPEHPLYAWVEGIPVALDEHSSWWVYESWLIDCFFGDDDLAVFE